MKTIKRRGQRTRLYCKDPSLTKQSFKKDCDINNIIKRFQKGHMIEHINKNEALYGDFSSPLTYQESMNIVIEAHNQFDNLPSKIRDRFNNDPQKFLEFTADEKNLDEMVELGLAKKRESKREKEPSTQTPEPSSQENQAE